MACRLNSLHSFVRVLPDRAEENRAMTLLLYLNLSPGLPVSKLLVRSFHIWDNFSILVTFSWARICITEGKLSPEK